MKVIRIIATLAVAGLVLAACAPPTPIVQIVTQPPVVVTQISEVEVTRQVDVVATQIVEVTPTPIGGQLVLYACLFDPDKLEVIFKTFKDKTGVTVTCLEMSSGEALERIRAEKDNPQGDVLFGTTNLSHVNLAAEGLTEPYMGTGWQQVPDGAAKDPEGYWTGFYYGVIGFACSPDALARINAECPTSWDDLLDPVFEDEIVIASPAASGTSYTVLSGLAQRLGVDGAFEYWNQWDANIAQYTSSGSAPARLAAQGEYAVGIAFAHDIQVQQDAGAPVFINFPSDGTPFEIGGISIIKGAKNLAAAQAWVDYVFSEAFQRYHNDVAHRIPVVTGVDLSAGNYGLDDVKLIDGYDPTEWAAERDGLIARWQEEIGSRR
jgi:iron(III) transport system substrate-binding protein